MLPRWYSADAHKLHRYSRRHETTESHEQAVKDHPYTGGRKNRVTRAQGRK